MQPKDATTKNSRAITRALIRGGGSIHILVFCLTNLFSKSLRKEHLKFLCLYKLHPRHFKNYITTMTHTYNILGDDSLFNYQNQD